MVPRLEAVVKNGLFFSLFTGIGVERNGLVPDLYRTGDGTKRRLNLGRQSAPKHQERQNCQHGHAKKTPDFFSLRARIISCNRFENWRDPRQTNDLEPCVGLVDTGKELCFACLAINALGKFGIGGGHGNVLASRGPETFAASGFNPG